jgi:glycosyltransferase involved in cell wall biosynthesis
MKKCINSILALGEDVEILIVDDGSNKDNTLEIAKDYEEKYPSICKAIHKKNGGHGDALNVGIKHAKGLFTKVVDSDDWIGKAEGKKLLSTIKSLEKKDEKVDLFVTNFIYDKVGAIHKKKMSYRIALPRNRVITWDDVRFWTPGTYMLMHALCYRTSVLKASKLDLPKKTFYVDNIYAYKPLVYVKKLYYLDVNLYHYFIGRNDQSVNE